MSWDVISIPMPTRGRPQNAKRFVDSVLATADRPRDVEILVCVDADDGSYDGWEPPSNVSITRTERKTLALYYNDGATKAKGDILTLGSDDVVYRTHGWDTKIREVIEQYPDRIVLAFADDGDPAPDKQFASIPFIHRNWVKTIGRFLPPYFSGDFVDTWLNDVADMIGRKVKVDILCEHLHPAFGKAADDATYREKWVKHFRDDMPQVYLDTLAEREAEAEKLERFIGEFGSRSFASAGEHLTSPTKGRA